jgi:hypothetical protein
VSGAGRQGLRPRRDQCGSRFGSQPNLSRNSRAPVVADESPHFVSGARDYQAVLDIPAHSPRPRRRFLPIRL